MSWSHRRSSGKGGRRGRAGSRDQLVQALRNFDGEVIVQGDEGPVCGVAQGVCCHGVTVGHQEREEEEVEQGVERHGEKTLKERCACPWMG